MDGIYRKVSATERRRCSICGGSWRVQRGLPKDRHRATLAPYTADRYPWFESLESNRRLLETHRSAADGRVRAWVGSEHIFYCSPQMFVDAAALAEEFDTGIHTHTSESTWEVEECRRQFETRPVQVFRDRGILKPKTVIAQGVWLDDHEVVIIAATGSSVIHCPCSDMKLASGAARVGYYRSHDVNVTLGTDGEKENNNLDMLEEMEFASLLQKVTTLDPTVGDPWDILDMATLSGVRALGLDDVTGSIRVGKDADLVAVDLRALHFVPTLQGEHFNAPSHLVFTASSHDVAHVCVRGRQLVEHGNVISVDVRWVAEQAQSAAEELFARRAASGGRRRVLRPTSTSRCSRDPNRLRR